MKVDTYYEYDKAMTSCINRLFGRNYMYARFRLMVGMGGDGESGVELLKRFRSTVNLFGDNRQLKALDELVSLIEDNPQYKARMHGNLQGK